MAKRRSKAEDEVPVRPSTRVAPPPARLLEPGQLTRFEDGSIWRVAYVTKGSASLRCLVGGKLPGNSPGRPLEVSTSATGHEIVGEDALATAKIVAEIEKKMCDRCWGAHGDEAPCDIECWCHEARYRPKARKAPPTDEEVARVLELRAAGLGYAAIEKEMGWPDTHGNRPWKIVRDAERAAEGGQ